MTSHPIGGSAPRADAPSRWRLLRHPAADGAWNMAVDEAVAHAVGAGLAPPTVRFFAWSRPTVSLGYLQPIRSDPLLAACRRHEVAVVRRPTGGRAVLHDAELTYSVAVPQQGDWGQLTVSQSYFRFGQALLAGLARLGIAASLGEPTPAGSGVSSGVACFSARRLPAVVVEGRKLIGSAQRRFRGVILQQGSILIRFDAGLHQRLFTDWPREQPSQGVAWLGELLGDVNSGRLHLALVDGWEHALGVCLESGELCRDEIVAASVLRETRYDTLEWTCRR